MREAVTARLAELSSDRERYTAPAPDHDTEEAVPIAVSPPPTGQLRDSRTSESPFVGRETPTFPVTAPADPTPFIEIGDQVRVRYLTGQSQNVIQVTISDRQNDLEKGIIGAHEPLATALLGAEEGEEIEVLAGSYVRKAKIENVVKVTK